VFGFRNEGNGWASRRHRDRAQQQDAVSGSGDVFFWGYENKTRQSAALADRRQKAALAAFDIERLSNDLIAVLRSA